LLSVCLSISISLFITIVLMHAQLLLSPAALVCVTLSLALSVCQRLCLDIIDSGRPINVSAEFCVDKIH